MNAYIFRDKWTIRFIKTYRFSGNPLNIFFVGLALGHSYQFCLASNLKLGVWCFFPLIYYRNENTIKIEMKILCKLNISGKTVVLDNLVKFTTNNL